MPSRTYWLPANRETSTKTNMRNIFVIPLTAAAIGIAIGLTFKSARGYYRTAQAAKKMEVTTWETPTGTIEWTAPKGANVEVSIRDSVTLTPTTALPTTMPEVTTAKGLLDGEGTTAKASDFTSPHTTTSSFTAIDPELYTPSNIVFRAGEGQIDISFKTGKVEIPEGVSNDEAARAFWQAVERYVPRTAQSLEGKVVVTQVEAAEVVRQLEATFVMWRTLADHAAEKGNEDAAERCLAQSAYSKVILDRWQQRVKEGKK
jgi:hypothetical protein